MILSFPPSPERERGFGDPSCLVGLKGPDHFGLPAPGLGICPFSPPILVSLSVRCQVEERGGGAGRMVCDSLRSSYPPKPTEGERGQGPRFLPPLLRGKGGPSPPPTSLIQQPMSLGCGQRSEEHDDRVRTGTRRVEGGPRQEPPANRPHTPRPSGTQPIELDRLRPDHLLHRQPPDRRRRPHERVRGA
jgi:hypothetical protein